MTADARPTVVLTHWVHGDVVDLLAARCRVVANETRDTLPPAEVLRRARDADALMAFMPDAVDDAFLSACPRLRVIGAALKGYDNFDAAACGRRGVWLTVVPDLLTEPTAELAVALALGLMRNVAAGDRVVRSGAFAGWRPILYGAGLTGATVGYVGMGTVGRATARRLAAFGTRGVYHDPAPLPADAEARLPLRRAALDDVLAAADVLIVAAPLTPQTKHLIGVAALARLRPGAYVVNVGRGSVVDEAAVADALATGRLAGYAADVFEFEDWARGDRPRHVEPRLLAMPARTLFTPHLGSAVDAVRRDIALSAARSILQALDGHTPDGAVAGPGPFTK